MTPPPAVNIRTTGSAIIAVTGSIQSGSLGSVNANATNRPQTRITTTSAAREATIPIRSQVSITKL